MLSLPTSGRIGEGSLGRCGVAWPGRNTIPAVREERIENNGIPGRLYDPATLEDSYSSATAEGEAKTRTGS